MWENGYGSDCWGYVCNRPADYSPAREDKHLKQLEREAYREKAKSCHQPNTASQTDAEIGVRKTQ